MSDKISKILIRQDTTANWNANKRIVLALGEPAIEIGANGKIVCFKIGDGITDWEHLGAQSTSDLSSLSSQVAQNTEDIGTLSGDISTLDGSVEGLQTSVGNLDGEINGENGIDARLENVETILSNKLPAVPNVAGTYTLKCTVDTHGERTYSWVLDEENPVL